MTKFWLTFMASVGVAGPSFATCPAANGYSFAYTGLPTTTLNYATTYTYTATNELGQSQNFTVGWTTNGVSSTIAGGLQMPRIDPLINNGVPTTARNLIVGMVLSGRTASITGTTRVIVTTFTFATPVRDFSIAVNDVDFTSNQFRDWLHITGTDGTTTYTPLITTPFNTNNTTGAKTAAGSTMALGAATTPFSQTNREVIGTANAPNIGTAGTLTASFVQPVTSISLRYGNHPVSPGGTATTQQAFGIQSIGFCPMPQLTLAKTSAPFITAVADPRRFNAPGSDVLYSLTLTNSDSSPVDLNQVILADQLPPQLSFFNGDIDGAGPLTNNFEFLPGASGLTLAPANTTYSNNGGVSHAYTPTAGYDANVNALRFNPQGTMAANSSATLRFRARIK